VTLNECRRQTSTKGLRSLAAPLGMLLARVAAVPFDRGCELDSNADRGSLERLLAATAESLQRGRARTRLGGARADALWRQFEAGAPRLAALRLATTLVHGDCSGRNILVRPGAGDTWSISGLIDWEAAFPGWGLWDVGSLFRYGKRYDAVFRAHFERGYRAAGGHLPEDWWRTSRLLDATRNVKTLNSERELPAVFEDCCDVLDSLLADGI
jgi:Ser/Thr protein kinase RdoA (MazF antagonist)